MQRVAILADVPWPTGSPGTVRVRQYADALSVHGCDVKLFPIGHFGSRAPESRGYPLAVAPEARFSSKFGIFGERGVRELATIIQGVRQWRPDWVVVYGRRLSTIGICTSLLPRRLKIALDMPEHPKLVLWDRGILSAIGWDHYLGARLLLRRAALVTAITPELATACRLWTRGSVRVLPGTLEPTRDVNHARQAIVGYYGSWNAKDDPAYVARCAVRLLSLDIQLRFEIVGSAPPPEIAALFQAASVASRIKYCGRVPDDQLAGTLSRWRLALLPRASCHSTRYSFPNRIAELMANAVPVAVKRNVGAGGLSSSSGILLIDSDAATGANELHRVLVANDLCSELSSSAHAASREHAPSGLVVGQAIKDIVQLAQPTQESSWRSIR